MPIKDLHYGIFRATNLCFMWILNQQMDFCVEDEVHVGNLSPSRIRRRCLISESGAYP